MSDSAQTGKSRGANFSPADLKLYYESPFASWMEQMNRDYPDHGIKPDLIAMGTGTADSVDPTKNKAFIEQLKAAGNQVVIITNDTHETGRQLNTVNAMRAGAHFIFNAHLQVVPLAGAIDILVRTGGSSRLGDYHYVPAMFYYNDPALTDMPVELCCFVDMLEHLQGVRPEEILQITNPNSASPHIARLPAEPWMFDYRKLKIGYRKAQMEFDPEDMPDPSRSRHWGRWSRHARKTLQRAAKKNKTLA